MDEFLGVLWSVSQSICSNSRATISEATASIEGNDGVEKVYLGGARATILKGMCEREIGGFSGS